MFFTTEIFADIFNAAGDSVTLINRDANYAADIERTAEGQSEDMWKATIKKNVEYLELIKNYKNAEGNSVWTSEDFTAIDKAIVDGKNIYS